MKEYENCTICPRNCGVNRYEKTGYCKMPGEIYIAKAYLHKWEEPSISGEKGSGTVFFTGCNLKCVYCQNYKIALSELGKKITEEELSEIFLKLQKDGANNINLVTPDHYIPSIVKALKIAKRNGLEIPIVYNSSSYINVKSLKMLDGIVDIYLADFKYMDSEIANKYSKAKDYPEIAKKAIEEMYRQTGVNEFFKNGIMKKGVIVRHLMLPGHMEDSKKIVEYLYEKYGDNIYQSIMNQYTPVRKTEFENLNRKVNKKSYEKLIDYALKTGVENAYIQEGETALESFIPEFIIE